MFFVVSKMAWRLVEPDNLLLAMAVLGAALAWLGRPRAGSALLGVALATFLLVASVPIGGMALGRLEQRFPEWRGDGAVDGIVILGGGLNGPAYFEHHGSGLNSGVARLIEAAGLAKKYPTARILYSGGPLPSGDAGNNEGRAASEILAALGVAPDRVTLELNSRDTLENALFAKRVLAPKPGERWLLVTSAFHMPRAIACFRAADFPVTAFPVDYRFSGVLSFGPGLADGLADLDLAAHELTGLVAYRWLGKTAELFPTP
jgi:uncharacterized SAM-binding protein YcdF (DUF218 family)